MAQGELIMVIAGAWGMIITILWLVIGWRAMKAHEKLADSQDEIRRAIRFYVNEQSRK
jgi:hypothetical protein